MEGGQGQPGGAERRLGGRMPEGGLEETESSGQALACGLAGSCKTTMCRPIRKKGGAEKDGRDKEALRLGMRVGGEQASSNTGWQGKLILYSERRRKEAFHRVL